MEALFLGIDTGTQGVRVAVCDAKGKICSSCEKKWDTSYPHLGWVEQSPMHWWESILEAMEECCRGLTAEQKLSIISGAVCATSSTTIPVKDDGTPLMPAIMWMDARSKEEMKAINATGHPMLQHCGGAVSCEWLVPKTLWIKRHDPEVYAQTDHVVEQLDWLNHQLTGVWCASKCNAVCKWNYSDAVGGYSDDYFETIGLPDYKEKMLLDVRRMGDEVGLIRPELAERFGFSKDLMIVQTGIDAHAAVFGMNAFAPGRMGVIMGTSFVHLAQVEGEPRKVTGIWGPYENALEDGRWLFEGGQITASGLVNWFRENFHTPVIDGNPYKALSEASLEIEPGAEGLTVLDFFQGNRTPYKDADAKGVIYGLNVKHTWKHIYKALLEAISFGTRNIIDNQINQGYDVDLVVGCGGVTKDVQWMQMIADITGKQIVVNEESQAGVMGCCVLAAAGGRYYQSFQEAADAMIRVKNSYTPDMEKHAAYEKPYQKYLKLYQNLKTMMSEE